MPEVNPFAAPQSDSTPERAIPPQGEVWRSGKTLVFMHGASLPERCIKCNTTEDLTLTNRRLYYYPPWVLLLILVNLIVLLVVALIVRKTSTAGLCLCRACRRRRRYAILTAWLGVLAGIMAIMSIVFVNESWTAPLIIASVAFFIAAAVIGIVWGQLLTVRKIDKEQVRLTGISTAYLDMLPVGP